ncbi:MAG: hypothetical protein E7627_04200 [Ruminococcaceae bacterium]|nr:hypothetical protein [Oscillospiraceae bacterium]
MEHKYIVVECNYICDAVSRKSYGIAYVCVSDGVVTILQSVTDITSDKCAIEHIVDLCCRLQLDPIHLNDIVEDYIERI